MRGAGASGGVTARTYQPRAATIPGMKIAVSGASGLIGSALVPALEAAGHRVLRLVRREAAGPNEVEWDPADGRIDAARPRRCRRGRQPERGDNRPPLDDKRRKAEILESRVASTSLLARRPRSSTRGRRARVAPAAPGSTAIAATRSSPRSRPWDRGFLADVGKAWEAAAEPARERRASGSSSFRQGIVLAAGTEARRAHADALQARRRAAASAAGSSGGAGSPSTTPSLRIASRSRATLAGPVNLTLPEAPRRTPSS